jgi:hypothetical protein
VQTIVSCNRTASILLRVIELTQRAAGAPGVILIWARPVRGSYHIGACDNPTFSELDRLLVRGERRAEERKPKRSCFIAVDQENGTLTPPSTQGHWNGKAHRENSCRSLMSHIASQGVSRSYLPMQVRTGTDASGLYPRLPFRPQFEQKGSAPRVPYFIIWST